jgi:hypothetical protein
MINDLAIELEKKVAKLPELSNSMAKEAARVIIQDLSITTPVDQGTAVSNWQVSLDTPNLAPIPAFNPSARGRVRKGVWEHSGIPEVTRNNNASEMLAAGNDMINSKQPGQPLFISNALPYISELNQGSSEQAPAGFVDRAEILAKSVMDKGLILG